MSRQRPRSLRLTHAHSRRRVLFTTTTATAASDAEPRVHVLQQKGAACRAPGGDVALLRGVGGGRERSVKATLCREGRALQIRSVVTRPRYLPGTPPRATAPHQGRGAPATITNYS